MILEDEENKTIKAVLLDIVLTDPTTQPPSKQKYQGDQVANIIKRIRPNIPIIAVSADARINGNINGYYPKRTLFDLNGMFDDLQEALSAYIKKEEEQEYYPEDGGGRKWVNKWGPKYIEFRNNPTFEKEEVVIGNQAREDFDILNNDTIEISYRKYRGADSLKNVLIVRRVILAAVLFNSRNLDIRWKDARDFLKLKEPGLENLMHECGIKWGGICNKSTMLNEEKKWLKAQGFL